MARGGGRGVASMGEAHGWRAEVGAGWRAWVRRMEGARGRTGGQQIGWLGEMASRAPLPRAEGRDPVWTEERGACDSPRAEGRASVWTDERGACDERGGKTEAAGARRRAGLAERAGL